MLQKEDVLTTGEAAELLRVSENAIRAGLAKGQLPGAKVGRAWRLSRQALANYLAQYQPPDTEEQNDGDDGEDAVVTGDA